VAGFLAWQYWPKPRPAPVPGNGAVASADEPWVVAISARGAGPPDAPSGKSCVGTLVSPKAVVTAAHCASAPGATRVIVGRTDLRTKQGHAVGVADAWTAPGWPERQGFFAGVTGPRVSPPDVGVLLLKTAVRERTLPMVTAGQATPAPGSRARVTGWRVSPQDEPVLWQTPTAVLDDDRCRQAAADASSLFPRPEWHGYRYDRRAYLCAGEGATAFPIRPTDSGSPLVVHGRLAGVANWKPGNDPRTPQFYGRVGTYTDRITGLIATATKTGRFPG